MSLISPEGRHRLVKAPSAGETAVRRAVAITLLGATAAAVGPLGAAAANAQTGPLAERSDVPAASTSTDTGTSSTGLYVTSWPRAGATTATSSVTAVSAPGGSLGLPGRQFLQTTVPSLLDTTDFPVPVAVPVGTTQVIAVKANSAAATAIVSVWQKNASGKWIDTASTTGARIGANGLAPGATRVQGTSTTPTGTYSITQGFGVGANPGTKMPYHVVTDQDWWVEDPTSAYYNQMRTAAQGGFHLTESGDDGSEHLINYPTQYNNALVINFNMNPTVVGRGAGIFLHDLGPQAGPTGGCVAVPAAFLTQIMQWIDPAQHPVIAIG